MNSNHHLAFRNVLSNFTALSLAEVLSRGLGFLATVHLARILGASEFGVIGFSIAILAYFNLIVEGGSGVIGTKEASRSPASIPDLAANILTLRILLALISYLLLLGFVAAIHKPEETKRMILLYGMILFTSAFLLDWVFYALEKGKAIAISSTLLQATYLGGVLWLIHQPAHSLRVPGIQAISEALAASFLLVLFLRRFPINWRAVGYSNLKRLIQDSSPIILSNFMRTINYSFDVVLIGFLAKAEVVGWYVAAYRIIYFIVGFAALYYRAFWPVVVRSFQQGLPETEALITQSMKVGAISIFPVAAAGIVLAQPLIIRIYGSGYENSIAPLQILLIAVVFLVLHGNYRHALFAADKQSVYVKLSACSAGMNVVLNFFLIPRYGLTGAAMATVLSEFIFLMVLHIVVRRRVVPVQLLQPLWRPALATTGMSLAVLLTKSHGFMISIATGATTYLALLVILRVIPFDVKSLFLKKS